MRRTASTPWTRVPAIWYSSMMKSFLRTTGLFGRWATAALVAERSVRVPLKKVGSVRTRLIARRLVLGLVRICLVRSGLSKENSVLFLQRALVYVVKIRERAGMSGGDMFKDKRVDRSVGDEPGASFAAAMSFIL
jgi:hypothetical protein